MNQLTTYELHIADQLQQLPVPDMADAIWSRIEQGLDVEMPVNESGHNNGSSSLPGFRFPGNILFYLFIIAFVSIVLYQRQSDTPKEEILIPSHVPVNSMAPQKNIRGDHSGSPVKNEQVPAGKADGKVVEEESETVISTRQPSVFTPAEVIKENNDLQKKDFPVVDVLQKKPAPLLTDSAPKKSRGVPSINANDYRIVPAKKDSLE